MKTKSIILIALFILFLSPFTVFALEWVPMTSGTTENLNSVWGSSGTNVFAVGGYTYGIPPDPCPLYQGIILNYDGVSWSGNTSSYLTSIWGNSANDVFAMGSYKYICKECSCGSISYCNPFFPECYWIYNTYQWRIIKHYDGATWSGTGSEETPLYGTWGSSGTDVFAVGDSGIILRFDGSTWSPMTSGTTNTLYGVWGSSGSDVFVVGAGGKILHYNGTSWTVMTSGTTSNLRGTWGSSGTDVFAVGDSGIILRFDGSTWSPMTSGTINTLYGVWGSSGTDVFAAGQLGTILHYDGSTWSPMTSGTTYSLYGIWGSSTSDVFAVGQSGTILHYGEGPTLITLSSFTATPSNRKVNLVWTTESEVNNAGFNLYRAESESGQYVKINESLIPAKGSPTSSATYECVDNDVKIRQTYYYKLEDIDLNGTSTMHGPVSVEPHRVWNAE